MTQADVDTEINLEDVRQASRELARKFDDNYWAEKDKNKEYPWEFVNAFAEAGWMGVMVPEKYGGLGLNLQAASVMLSEVAASGAGTAGASAIHFYIFPPGPILRHGSEEMRQKYMPQLAAGKLLMAFAVTEPNAGVDTSRITTKAEKTENGWVINGHKIWITNAKNADRVLIVARTSPRDPEKPFDGVTLFFSDFDRDKITVHEIDKMGRAAVDSNELFIDNLEVSDDDVVGEVGKGFTYLLDGLNPERVVVGLEQVGLGRAALDVATRYANERVIFDRPIGKNQAIAHPLADSWIRLHAAELVGMEAARLYDEGQSCGPEANAAKFLGSEAGFEACDRALQTLGGYSYAKEYHVERYWRESRLLKIAPVSQGMVLNFISNKVLGLPKSY